MVQGQDYINLAIKVSKDIAMQAKNGRAQILGLAKDAETHRILKHLQVVEFKQESNVCSALHNTSRRAIGKEAAGLVIVGAITTAVFVGLGYLFWCKKKKEESVKLTKEFHNEISKYVDGVRDGTLSFDDLEKFTNFIGSIAKDVQNKKIKIALSPDELVSLKSIVEKVTVEAIKQRGDNNKIQLITVPSSEVNPVKNLESIRQNLECQLDVIGCQLKKV